MCLVYSRYTRCPPYKQELNTIGKVNRTIEVDSRWLLIQPSLLHISETFHQTLPPTLKEKLSGNMTSVDISYKHKDARIWLQSWDLTSKRVTICKRGVYFNSSSRKNISYLFISIRLTGDIGSWYLQKLDKRRQLQVFLRAVQRRECSWETLAERTKRFKLHGRGVHDDRTCDNSSSRTYDFIPQTYEYTMDIECCWH